ncbi:MAG: hybrid sensor histidine kinase/response regulator [Comamonadaceae bacterium]|nr:MAG: hybrid sensor histidine kinase/response regulator [Comamonadaceae bacterium]
MPPPTDVSASPGAPASGQASALRERLLHQLYLMGQSTMTAAPVTGIITWGLFYALTQRPAVLVWGLLLHATQAWRWRVIRRNVRGFGEPPRFDGPPNDARPYVLLLFASALAWGSASWLLLPAPGGSTGPLTTSELAAVLAVMAFGMMAGSVPGVAPWRHAVLGWLPPAALLLGAGFAWHGGIVGWLLALCSMTFGAAMTTFALVQHRLIEGGLRSQIEKEALSEQLMLQSRDLERLNQERSRFFASASHDLRQPVHALALFSNALRRDLQGHPAQAVAERVVEATEQVSELLNGMLDLSRIDAGAVQPVFAPLAVDQVFLRLNQIYEPSAAAAGLSLRFHISPRPPLHTDVELLFRILSNLVDNALKYCQRGGILVSARQHGDGLRLAVWDTGRGILPEHQPMLFDEFYQVDNAHRSIANGLGIGLAIVKRLATLLDARLGLRSVPGRGSVFWIDLPAHPDRAGADAAAVQAARADVLHTLPSAPPMRAGARLELLLLDDEASVCEAMRIWLQPHCRTIHTALTLEDAQALVQRHGQHIDAMVVDYRLAGRQNGIEAARLLRDSAGREIPAILVTGDTDPARVRAAYDSGLVVMFKPVQPEQLMSALQALGPGTEPPA